MQPATRSKAHPSLSWMPCAKEKSSCSFGSRTLRLSPNYQGETMEIETDVPADLEQVAEKYRAEGYEVTLHPRGDQLPPFAAAFHPEILARNGGLQVLVAVKED